MAQTNHGRASSTRVIQQWPRGPDRLLIQTSRRRKASFVGLDPLYRVLELFAELKTVPKFLFKWKQVDSEAVEVSDSIQVCTIHQGNGHEGKLTVSQRKRVACGGDCSL